MCPWRWIVGRREGCLIFLLPVSGFVRNRSRERRSRALILIATPSATHHSRRRNRPFAPNLKSFFVRHAVACGGGLHAVQNLRQLTTDLLARGRDDRIAFVVVHISGCSQDTVLGFSPIYGRQR